MAASLSLKIDKAGIGRVAKSQESKNLVRDAAEQVANNVDAQNLTYDDGDDVIATVDTYTTDRAAASVAIEHPAGMLMQARHGVLTKAAAAAGLEVRKK